MELSELYLRMKEYDKSVKCYLDIFEMGIDNSGLWYNLVWVYKERLREDYALWCATQAQIRGHPKAAEIVLEGEKANTIATPPKALEQYGK